MLRYNNLEICNEHFSEVVMSWRFRKTFKVLPGVKLNLTSRGLSATFGAAPFSVNVGPRGVYRNVSIPGTGIWDRQRFGGPSSQLSAIRPPTTDYAGDPVVPTVPPSISVAQLPSAEIHSASTELLTSESLEQLRGLLTDAWNERDALTKEVSTATLEANSATRRYQKWGRGFLMKRLFKQSFAARKEAGETAVAKLEELQEQLRLTTIAIEITVQREQAEAYYRMRDAFSALSECQKIWNVLTEQTIDRIAERSRANTAVTRDPVSFSLNSCDLIQWEQKVPHLPNRTGGDMYIYPGFILYRASKQAFALIDFREVALMFVSTEFTENGAVPSDTQIIGHTWAKCNKDGSPDRRFHDNYQIPVAHYGTVLFSSRDGLDVRYLCSNTEPVDKFVKAWTAFRMSFIDSQPCAEPAHEPTRPGVEVKPDTMKQCKTANHRFLAALKEFRAANDKFVNIIRTNSSDTPSGSVANVSIPKQDLDAYMATVLKLIDMAKENVAAMESAMGPILASEDKVGEKLVEAKLAIQGFETSRVELEQSAYQGHMDLAAYSSAVKIMFDAIGQLQDRFAEALAI